MRARLDNRDMNKRPHVFTWDNEPTDERPSVFEASTSPTESWFEALPADHVTKVRRPPPKRNLARMVLWFALALSLCSFALYQVLVLLRG